MQEDLEFNQMILRLLALFPDSWSKELKQLHLKSKSLSRSLPLWMNYLKQLIITSWFDKKLINFEKT